MKGSLTSRQLDSYRVKVLRAIEIHDPMLGATIDGIECPECGKSMRLSQNEKGQSFAGCWDFWQNKGKPGVCQFTIALVKPKGRRSTKMRVKPEKKHATTETRRTGPNTFDVFIQIQVEANNEKEAKKTAFEWLKEELNKHADS